MRLFRRDFGIGIRHREDHRIVRHRPHHVLRDRALHAHAQEHIRIDHRFFQRPRLGLDRMRRFPLVHAFGAALVDHTLGVGDDAVLMPRAHPFEQLDTGDARRARAVQHDLYVLDFFARQVQRVDQTGRTDHRRAVLVIVEDRDIHLFLEPLLDDETLRRLDVFEVDPAKGRPHQPHRLAEFIRVFGIQLDIDGVHIGETLEENRFPLHHRLGPQRPKIAQPQNRRAIGHHRNKVALVGVVIGQTGVLRDVLARHRHTR